MRRLIDPARVATDDHEPLPGRRLSQASGILQTLFRCVARPAKANAAFVDQELTPASAALRREMERRFADALAHLGEDDREVILMRHFEQLSNQDMAAALGLTEPAASMRYLRAVRRLKAALVDESERGARRLRS